MALLETLEGNHSSSLPLELPPARGAAKNKGWSKAAPHHRFYLLVLCLQEMPWDDRSL